MGKFSSSSSSHTLVARKGLELLSSVAPTFVWLCIKVYMTRKFFLRFLIVLFVKKKNDSKL